MKIKVKITRTETYERIVEVEAKDEAEALQIAEDNEQENEYSDMFDCPDDVDTKFSIPGNEED